MQQVEQSSDAVSLQELQPAPPVSTGTSPPPLPAPAASLLPPLALESISSAPKRYMLQRHRSLTDRPRMNPTSSGDAEQQSAWPLPPYHRRRDLPHKSTKRVMQDTVSTLVKRHRRANEPLSPFEAAELRDLEFAQRMTDLDGRLNLATTAAAALSGHARLLSYSVSPHGRSLPSVIEGNKEKLKPKLVSMLENMVNTELSRIVWSGDETADALQRLSVFREAFRLAIEHFSSVGSFMNQIMLEYDNVVNFLLSELRVLQNETEPGQIQPRAVQRRQLQANGNGGRTSELSVPAARALATQVKINQQAAEIESLKCQLLYYRSQRDQLEAKYQEQSAQMKELESKRAFVQSNAAFLASQVKEIRDYLEKFQEKSMQLEGIQAKYDKVKLRLSELMMQQIERVPRGEFEDLERQYRQLKQQHDQQYQQLRTLGRICRSLQSENYHKVAELQFLNGKRAPEASDLEELRRAMTPRPDYSRLTMLVTDEEDDDAINAIAQEAGDANTATSRSSIALVHEAEDYILSLKEKLLQLTEDNRSLRLQLNDLTSSNGSDVDVPKLFVAYGRSSLVPVYLRHHGVIKNLCLPKRHLEIMISEIVDERMHDRRLAKRVDQIAPLDRFLDNFFAARTNFVQVRKAELAYSFSWALERYQVDSDCYMFLCVLRGYLPEDVWSDQQNVLDQLLDAFRKADAEDEEQRRGLTKIQIMEVVEKVFRFKSRERIDFIRQALDMQVPALSFGRNKQQVELVDYESLFDEDADKNQGPFIEEIRHQYCKEIEEYYCEISCALVDRDVAHTSGSTLTIHDIQQAFAEVDPAVTVSDIRQVISKVMMIDDGEAVLRDDSTVDMELFIKRLKEHVLIKRQGPKPQL